MRALTNLWGEEVTPFTTAKERLGVWPTTVWPCDMSDRDTQELKDAVADTGATRLGSQRGHTPTRNGYQCVPSVFNPAVAGWLLNCYGPERGLVFDPFAGGGTRALMCAARGLAYLGVELREVEAADVRQRAQATQMADFIHIETGDSRDCSGFASTASADFVLTCPPYWNLEKYGGGPADLSEAATYEEFLAGLDLIIRECHRVLRPGAMACWVVGLHRTHPEGALVPLHHDVARLHTATGFRFKEEVVLWQQNNGALRRVGSFEKADRRLIRVHEYALVFVREETP